MRKLLIIAALMVVGPFFASAQKAATYDPAGRWYLSVQGGPMYQRNENSFTYEYFKKPGKLITYQVAASIGYDFTSSFGLRGTVEYGQNRSAANYWETAAKGVYAYEFKNISAFVDGVLNFNGLNVTQRGFAPKVYAGLGYAHTFNFVKPDDFGTPYSQTWQGPFHPWQDICEKNHVFGFRVGGIFEYDFLNGLGLFADIAGEAYTDWFNGLEPDEIDHTQGTGYAGFPFDLRVNIMFGITYRFK